MAYLTAPVHDLSDFQVEYAGLLMGPGTNFDLPPSWDFLDMAAVKVMDVARVWADGSFSGPDFADELTIPLDIEIFASDGVTFGQAVMMYLSVFTAQSVDQPFWFKIPNLAVFGIGAKVNKRTLPVDLPWGQLSQDSVELRAVNPLFQSVSRTVTLSGSAASSSGLVFPMFNLASGAYAVPGVADFGAADTASSSATLSNAGNTAAYPVVVVNGPTTQPFSILLDGNAVTYSGTLAATDSLSIDYASGLATLNGSIDRTYLLTARSFSGVPAAVLGTPGTSSILFASSSGACLVTTADVWR
jgi:hypothetical protein